MDDDDYQKAPAQEWKEATAAKSSSRKNAANAKAGEKALAACRRMLEEVVEPPTAPALPCEHDYKPCPFFAFTLRCTKCPAVVEDPKRPPSPERNNEPSLESYKDLTQ